MPLDDQQSEHGILPILIYLSQDGIYAFYLQSIWNLHVMLHDKHYQNIDFHYSDIGQSVTMHLKNGLCPLCVFYKQNDKKVPSIGLQKKADLELHNRDSNLFLSKCKFRNETVLDKTK